ncbi:MAG: putative structural protein [Podoviridae sp. ctbj_2]|nr:MAG: putative structural protein [Podoviridae sp. ctbj_2]
MNNSYDKGLGYYNGKLSNKKRTLNDAKLAYYNQVTGRNDRALDVAEMWFYILGGDTTLPANQAVLSDAASVTLLPATGTTPAQGTATAAVAASAITGVRLAANRVAITTAATAPVQNSAGAAIGTGTITVAANAISNIRLPATVAGVSNGAALTVPVTGTYTNTATIAVANGVITGITLS